MKFEENDHEQAAMHHGAAGRASPQLQMLIPARPFCASRNRDVRKGRAEARPGASGLQGAAFIIFGGDAVRSHRFPYMQQPWRVSPEPTKTQEDVPEAQALKSGGAQCKSNPAKWYRRWLRTGRHGNKRFLSFGLKDIKQGSAVRSYFRCHSIHLIPTVTSFAVQS